MNGGTPFRVLEFLRKLGFSGMARVVETPVKILYVVNTGRSGATILNIMLGGLGLTGSWPQGDNQA